MFNNFYKLDFARLVKNNVFYDIRKPNLLRLLGILVSPIVFVYQDFLRYRAAKIYEMSITPQVCSLEKMLNDRFDFSQRRIRIVDATWHQPWYLYQELELKDDYLFLEPENLPIGVYTDSEAATFDDFVVLVPASIAFNMNEMKGNLNKYKAGGFHYKIELV